jgi:hypothetical protein
MAVSDRPASGSSHGFATLLVAIVGGLVVAVFLPLILAILESLIFHSNHVEGFFEKIGLHDELSAIYDPLFKFISKLF